MELDFPYQIVVFVDKVPVVDEPIYKGKNGWYPNMALKRRFKLNHIAEKEFVKELKSLFAGVDAITIKTGELIKPERLPVKVIEVINGAEIIKLHNKILDNFSEKITSRYPEREHDNYYAHITAEHDGDIVFTVDNYTNRTFFTNNIWLRANRLLML